MILRLKFTTFKRSVVTLLLLGLCSLAPSAQQVKRLVIIKVDGLPGYYVDQFVRQRDRDTGKSVLPWIDEVFYKNGTRIPNFYTRGMSLSGPSWGELDTGQHLQIKGNVEFDRYTLHAYDYLSILPFYFGYGLNKVVDMPGVEVLDEIKLPLLCDAFTYDQRYTSPQLYQRGFDWAQWGSGAIAMFPKDKNDLIDEWTLGFNFRRMTIEQNERDIVGKLVKRPDIDYYDYYDPSFDHVSHHNNDPESRLVALKELDRTIGRIWTADQQSSRAGETAIVLVSDHGFNSSPKVYSQGFNLVKLLGSAEGGGHHVITKRRLLLDYALKSMYPFIDLIRTGSNDSFYLQGQAGEYPTALVDFDGNERSSIHLRNADLNILHILLQQLQQKDVKGQLREAAADACVAVVERNRSQWQQTRDQMTEELAALHRWIDRMRPEIARLSMKKTDTVPSYVADNNRRLREQVERAVATEKDERAYLATLEALLALKRVDIINSKFKIDDLIAKDAMGDENTVGQLQDYVVGPTPGGLVLDATGQLDAGKSFRRVNYFQLLIDQRVRNNIQPGVSNRPIDFVATRVPLAKLKGTLPAEMMPDSDAVWIYGGPQKQVLILSRSGTNGEEEYLYLPVENLRESGGKLTFETRKIGEGFPLHYFEDAALNVAGDRTAWFDAWHTETEWMHAIHKAIYSNGIIGLTEQLDQHPFGDSGLTGDEALIQRFRQRQRRLTEADLLILASDHWNFDVRGFNPGGNHGSFFRASTNSTFMIAGGDATRIPRGLAITEPYDSLSFMPTLLRLMGRIDDHNDPTPEMYRMGYRRFPGKVVSEVFVP
ncbi:MAG TPA: alkaline phosphatase family protein [Pyrinomonadaceae bacterium]|nr:alkaline phosphatase family protein [Pyrinomonadaceae bacterium]